MVFADLPNSQSYSISKLAEIDEVSGPVSMQVESGAATITLGAHILWLDSSDNKHFSLRHREQQQHTSVLMEGSAMKFHSTEGGLVQLIANGLAISQVTPGTGSKVTTGDVISVEFNNLINTQAEHIQQKVTLLVDGQVQTDIGIEAVNTLSGGKINITVPTLEEGELTLKVAATLSNINGEQLGANGTFIFSYTTDEPVQINAISRLSANSQLLNNYFHADGSEVAVMLALVVTLNYRHIFAVSDSRRRHFRLYILVLTSKFLSCSW